MMSYTRMLRYLDDDRLTIRRRVDKDVRSVTVKREQREMLTEQFAENVAHKAEHGDE